MRKNVTAKTTVAENDLGAQQRELQLAAAAYSKAQVSYTNAKNTLKAAEETYIKATQNFITAVEAVRVDTSVKPIGV